MNYFLEITDREEMIATVRAHLLEPEKQESGFIPYIKTKKNIARFPEEKPHLGGWVFEGTRVAAIVTKEQEKQTIFQLTIDGKQAAFISVDDLEVIGLLKGKRTTIFK